MTTARKRKRFSRSSSAYAVNGQRALHPPKRRRYSDTLIVGTETLLQDTTLVLRPENDPMPKLGQLIHWPLYENPFLIHGICAKVVSAPKPEGLLPLLVEVPPSKRQRRSTQFRLNTGRLENGTSISIQRRDLYLKCPWCIMKHLEKTTHEDHCYCSEFVSLKTKMGIHTNPQLCLQNMLFNNIKLFQEHLVDTHFHPIKVQVQKVGYKTKKQRLTAAMDTPHPQGWITCPFSDCGIKHKTLRTLIDHMLRKHSQAIRGSFKTSAVARQGLGKLENRLSNPLGTKASFLVQREYCLHHGPKDGSGTFLECFYNGLNTTDFINGENYDLSIPKDPPPFTPTVLNYSGHNRNFSLPLQAVAQD